MKVLITGAGGNLGRALMPLLLEQGHTLRLMDFRAVETPHDFVEADVRDFAAVKRAVEGVDAIVHAAALHGIHLRKWTPQDFWAINVTGTFNIFEAARQQNIKRVVLCSTMGVYGESATPPPDAWGVVTEELPCLPSDVYGMSKDLCEDMASFYSRRWGVTTVALRLGMFVPEVSVERYGFRLLFGGVDDRDVAHAVLRSLSYQPENGFDFFNIMADVPFTSMDAPALQNNKREVLERHYPELRELLESRQWKLDELMWGRTIWLVEKAKRLLGYHPQHNFDSFVRAATVGDSKYHLVADTPWWGV